MSTPDLPHLRNRHSRRLVAAALVLLGALIAFVIYERLVTAPAREQAIRRYNEFRDAVASGETERIMQFVAPEFRPWAEDRLHMYQNFARPLDHRSTVSILFGEATICPEPGPGFLIIFERGHVIKMLRHNGEWFVGRVHID